MKINEGLQDIEEYLKTLTCRGCYNQCSLNNPGCGKSKIWINEAIEKFKKEKYQS